MIYEKHIPYVADRYGSQPFSIAEKCAAIDEISSQKEAPHAIQKARGARPVALTPQKNADTATNMRRDFFIIHPPE